MIPTFVNFTFLTVSALLCALLAVALSYRKIYYALSAANVGLVLAFIDKDIAVSTLIFWLVAASVAGFIVYMLPDEVRTMRTGVSFFVTGALAGTAVGVAFGSMAALIIGAAAGIFFGALIFSNAMPEHDFKLTSKKYLNYILAKGLPILVVMCIVGIILAQSIGKMNNYLD